MLKSFTSKKAQAGIGENIGNLLQVMPKPLKIGLFLLFLLLFSAMFSYILSGVGVHCSSTDDAYTLPVYDFIHNMELLIKRPNWDAIQSYSVEPEQLTVALAFECVHAINDSFYFEGTFCTDCESQSYISFLDDSALLPARSAVKVCVGDVFYNSNKNWFKRLVCETGSSYGCDVPNYYFFNSSTGLLQPLSNASVEFLTVGQMWDVKLKELGGERIYPEGTTTGRAYDHAFRITCSEVVPELKFFGIPLFDFRIWVVLILVSGFGMFLMKLHEWDK